MAVHGLDGHWRKTWTHENGLSWLEVLLPKSLPNSRIYSYGYDSRTHGSSPITQQFIHDFSRQLVSELVLERETKEVSVRPIGTLCCLPGICLKFGFQTTRRPIIFIVHSLGGLVVKSVRGSNSPLHIMTREKALIHSNSAPLAGRRERDKSIASSTYGVMFFGTPHQGGRGCHRRAVG